jgi:hypothetical protein
VNKDIVEYLLKQKGQTLPPPRKSHPISCTNRELGGVKRGEIRKK